MVLPHASIDLLGIAFVKGKLWVVNYHLLVVITTLCMWNKNDINMLMYIYKKKEINEKVFFFVDNLN